MQNPSLPDDRVLHGIQIRKLTIGDYVRYCGKLAALPEQAAQTLFAGITLDDLAQITADQLPALLLRLLKHTPQLVDIAADLIGAETDALLALTPEQLLEVAEAFVAANDYTDFFARGSRLLTRIGLPASTGCSRSS